MSWMENRTQNARRRAMRLPCFTTRSMKNAQRMTLSLKLALTVDLDSALTFTRFRRESRYSTDIGSSGQGTITRIENLAERISFYLINTQRDLEEVEKQLEAARQQMGQPFIV